MTVVFGGTFDPVHNGHLFAANTVSRLLGHIPVQIVVAGNPRLRGSTAASESARWDMVQLACAEHECLIPNEIELHQEGPTLTADTVLQMQGEPSRPVVWIVGSDAMSGLHKWRKVDELRQRASFVVLCRLNYPLLSDVPGFERTNEIQQVRDRSGRFHAVQEEMPNISATLVRYRIKNDLSISSMVHPSVRDYIIKYDLYRT